MITTQQVADLAGVSRSCVSQVINDSPNSRIASQTRQAVLDAARELGYRKRKVSGAREVPAAIAYVFCENDREPRQSYPYRSATLNAMQHLVQRDDRVMLYYSLDNQRKGLSSLCRSLAEAKPLGVLLDGFTSRAVVDAMRNQGFAVVASGHVDGVTDPVQGLAPFDQVVADLEPCVTELMDRLAETGSRSTVLVSNPLLSAFDQAILDVFRRWHEANGRPFSAQRVQICEQRHGGSELLIRLRSLGIDYDSVLFGSASLADPIIGILDHEARTLDQPMPHLAVIGAPEIHPSISHVAYMGGWEHAAFAGVAYELLSARISNNDRASQRLVVPPHFNTSAR